MALEDLTAQSGPTSQVPGSGAAGKMRTTSLLTRYYETSSDQLPNKNHNEYPAIDPCSQSLRHFVIIPGSRIIGGAAAEQLLKGWGCVKNTKR
jgi:hypothetical protein